MRWLDELLASEGGDPGVRAWAYFMRGFLAVLKADPAAARPALQAAVAAARQAEQPYLLTEALSMASNAENMAGDHASARLLLDEAHVTATGLGYPPGTLAVLQARVLNGFFEADLGTVREESAVAALGAAKFEAEFDAGKRLDRDTAWGLALGQPAHVAAVAPDDASAGLLGNREADVARLVADGLTNKQIGTRLFISERTVDSHVRSILNKLGFNSRAQIAAWMASSNQQRRPD